MSEPGIHLRRSSRGAPADFSVPYAPARRTTLFRDPQGYGHGSHPPLDISLRAMIQPRNGVEVSGVRLMLRCEVVQNGKAPRLSPPLRRQPVSAQSSAFRATPVRNGGRQSRAAHFPSTLLPRLNPGGYSRQIWFDMAGPDPRPNCAPSRDSHGQQNAHRRLAPGRNPGGGRSR
jgi:hypothetical protein